MSRAEQCRYTKEHEWVFAEGDVVTVGITDFAQKELGDIVYVDLSQPGTALDEGAELGTVESVKAVAEVYAPLQGEIVEINGDLESQPEKVNEDPLGGGWLVKMRLADASAVEGLMDLKAYTAFLEQEG